MRKIYGLKWEPNHLAMSDGNRATAVTDMAIPMGVR